MNRPAHGAIVSMLVCRRRSAYPLMGFQAQTIGALAVFALTFVSVVASSRGAYRQDYVIAPGQIHANHGSSMVELQNGTLLSCWYAGSDEMAADARILCSRLEQPQARWTTPQVVVAAGERASHSWLSNGTLGNTALHLSDDGRLWLFYNATTLARGWSATHVAYKTSVDGGKSWSAQGTRITAFWGNSIKK